MKDAITEDKILTPEKIVINVADTKASILHEEGDLEAELTVEEEKKRYFDFLEQHEDLIAEKDRNELEQIIDETDQEELREKLSECYIAVRNLLIANHLKSSEDDGLAG